MRCPLGPEFSSFVGAATEMRIGFPPEVGDSHRARAPRATAQALARVGHIGHKSGPEKKPELNVKPSTHLTECDRATPCRRDQP